VVVEPDAEYDPSTASAQIVVTFNSLAAAGTGTAR